MSENYRSRQERRQAITKKKVKKKPTRGLFKNVLLFFLILGIVGMVAGGTTFFVLAKDAPPLDESLLQSPLSSVVLDRNGEKIYEFGVEKRTYVSIDEIPDILKDAVIAVEDARFYDHHGLDIIRLGGAIVANFKEGYGAEGGSTISQQLIKNSFFSHEKRFKRKVQELWMAFQLERKYSKDQILEMYLNKIYYGVGNTYGVAKASEIYLGKSLDEIELHEAALIAGLGQNPGIYNPFKYPERAENRRNVVLSLMERHGFITSEEAQAAMEIPIEDSIVESLPDSQPIESFLDQVKKEIAEQTDLDVYSAGLTIHTSFDPKSQEYIDTVLNSEDVVNYPNDEFQAGIALTDTQTGEILALGGGRNQSEQSRINFALDPLNQPGSTIKPILDYGPAVEYLQWSTYQQIVDEPYTYSDGKPINNWDRKHRGQISLRQALAESRNIPALKALQEVGVEKARKFAVSLGMPFEESINEAYSIGGTESGISPLQMAGAYGAFGNDGEYIKPHAVRKIVFKDDRELVFTPEAKQVMSDSTAFMITDVLKSVMLPGGTANGYNVPGLHIAGKTGTTNYTKDAIEKYNIPNGAVPDAWFAGYTPKYSVAIWTGYKDNNQWINPGDEQHIARILFKNIISHVSSDEDKVDFSVPDSVVKIGVEKGSNPAKLPSEFTPKDQIVYEYFIKGTEPTTQSDKYKRLSIPGSLNIAFDQETNKITLAWSYPENELDAVTFEVSQSIDEGPFKVLTTTKDLTFTVDNPIPEAIYSFRITAISDKSKENRSEPATTSITIPVKVEDEIDIPTPGEEEQEEQNEQDEPSDPENANPGHEDDNGEGQEGQREEDLPDIIIDPPAVEDEEQDNPPLD